MSPDRMAFERSVVWPTSRFGVLLTGKDDGHPPEESADDVGDAVLDGHESSSATNIGEDIAARALADMEMRRAEHEADSAVEEAIAEQNRGRGVGIGLVTVAIAAVGVGLWAANSGDDDSAALGTSTTVESETTTAESETTTAESETNGGVAVGSAAAPPMGWEWMLLARNSNGHTAKETQFDHYIRAVLKFADGQELDEQKPRYNVTFADVYFPAVNQEEQGADCTYTGTENSSIVDLASFTEGSYLQFDLTTTPISYRLSLTARDVERTVFRTCGDSVGENNYGNVIQFANSFDSETGNILDWGTNAEEIAFISGFYQQGGGENQGFSRVYWTIDSCDATACSSLDDDIRDVATFIDQAVQEISPG